MALNVAVSGTSSTCNPGVRQVTPPGKNAAPRSLRRNVYGPGVAASRVVCQERTFTAEVRNPSRSGPGQGLVAVRG